MIEILARAGYAAKGVVYLGIGLLTATAALAGGSGNAQGSRDALSRIGRGDWGTILLIVVAFGIAGYVVWKLVQAVGDPEKHGGDLKGLATRGVFLVSALTYASLGVWIVRSLAGRGSASSTSSGGGADSWSATLLSQPFGAWLLGLAGLAIVVYGLVEWRNAAVATFEDRLGPDLDGSARRWVRRIARVGLVSRGLVFVIVGGFVIHAARTANPSEARGLEGALEALGSTTFGPWLMGVVALGLAGYGILQLVKSRYRRVAPVSP